MLDIFVPWVHTIKTQKNLSKIKQEQQNKL